MPASFLTNDQVLSLYQIWCSMETPESLLPSQAPLPQPATVDPQELALLPPSIPEFTTHFQASAFEEHIHHSAPFAHTPGQRNRAAPTTPLPPMPVANIGVMGLNPDLARSFPTDQLSAWAIPTNGDMVHSNSARHNGPLTEHHDPRLFQPTHMAQISHGDFQLQSGRVLPVAPTTLPPSTKATLKAPVALTSQFQAPQSALGIPRIMASSLQDQHTSHDDDTLQRSISERPPHLTLSRRTECHSHKTATVTTSEPYFRLSVVDFSPSSASSPLPSPTAMHSTSAYDTRVLKRTKPRTKQVSLDKRNLKPVDGRCPHCLKKFKRKSELFRHINLHFDPSFICCGVPISNAARYGVTDFTSADVVAYAGKRMVGGCMKRFTRVDGLSRHLRNTGCKGAPKEDWCNLKTLDQADSAR